MTREEILTEIGRSRGAIARSYQAVRAELDVASQLGRSVRRKPLAWLGGAAALGWLLAGPKTKTRVITRPAKGGAKTPRPEAKAAARFGALAFLVSLARLAFPLLKPLLTAYAGRRLVEFAGRFGRP